MGFKSVLVTTDSSSFYSLKEKSSLPALRILSVMGNSIFTAAL